MLPPLAPPRYGVPISLAAIALTSVLATGAAAQRGSALPQALHTMLQMDERFAARALEVGWKDAFLEYLAPGAIGFERGQAGPAYDQVRHAPDPPADLHLTWHPRFGDIAASGELGYVTGPLQSIQGSRDGGGRVRHSTYLSIWRRQQNGLFRVALNIGTPTPAAPAFPGEFTRAPHDNRFTGDYDERTPPLAVADGVMNSALRSSSQARAYRGRLADDARLYRPNSQPFVGEASILRWLESQPRWSATETRYAESARSGDLGYTIGTYTIGSRSGYYVRVWVRERTGQWQIAVDVLAA
jgi:ketosteroid isomerase-like protein